MLINPTDDEVRDAAPVGPFAGSCSPRRTDRNDSREILAPNQTHLLAQWLDEITNEKSESLRIR